MQAPEPRPRRPLATAGYVVSLTVQLVMVVLGLFFILAEGEADVLSSLILWCTVGTLYAVVALVVLGRLSRHPGGAASRPGRVELSRPARIVSMTATILASLTGLVAAVQVLGIHSNPDVGIAIEVVGVWAMLLSWGFLHWGFAQVYYQRYFAAEEPPLRFPGTPNPRILDFVYFSYTLGTTFATSDVETLGPRIRWTIVWHSVLSFFFNGLIIVLALNTITKGGA
jgi:uncharacterized membrane protein